MKIIVLHGDDTAKSYSRLTKFIDSAKSRSWEIVHDELPNTPSLFGSGRLIIFRDFRLLTKADLKNLSKFDGTMVIYHDSVLPSTFLKSMPADFKMEKFELPKLLFTFLDSLVPGNDMRVLKLFHEVVETNPVELVFFFLAKHFRDLYWVASDAGSTGFPGWKIQKLKTQASKFPIDKIKEIIGNLADIDMEVKSSKADLLTQLDLLLVKELE